MISADTKPSFEALVRALDAKARALAEAAGEKNAMARSNDPQRWRSARLLWPLFTKG